MVRHSLSLALPGLLAGLLSLPAKAEDIDLLMNGLFPKGELTYIGFDSVEREDIPEASGLDRKYLIVDFRSEQKDNREDQVARVHKVCSTLLENSDLIRDLTRQGYDMVSVAFNRNYQYDCLP